MAESRAVYNTTNTLLYFAMEEENIEHEYEKKMLELFVADLSDEEHESYIRSVFAIHERMFEMEQEGIEAYHHRHASEISSQIYKWYQEDPEETNRIFYSLRDKINNLHSVFNQL